MTTTPDDTSSPQPDIEQLQAEIEQTREQLGETVDALTAKLDVKSRTRARLTVVALVAATVLVWRKRR
jgi:hypothetical protein